MCIGMLDPLNEERVNGGKKKESGIHNRKTSSLWIAKEKSATRWMRRALLVVFADTEPEHMLWSWVDPQCKAANRSSPLELNRYHFSAPFPWWLS